MSTVLNMTSDYRYVRNFWNLVETNHTIYVEACQGKLYMIQIVIHVSGWFVLGSSILQKCSKLTSTHLSFPAIYNFDGKVKMGLPLNIGDTVQIIEECQGKYSIKLFNKNMKLCN